MRLTLIQLTPFVRKWSKLGLNDEDLQSLEGILVENPQAGDVVPGTGGLRKFDLLHLRGELENEVGRE